MKRFIYRRKDGRPSRPVSLAIVMSVAALRVVAGRGPFRLKTNEDLNPQRTRRDILLRLRRQLRKGDVGDQYRIVDREDQEVFRVRETKPAIKVIDTNGNAKADRLWSAVKVEFKALSFLGAYVCKLIIGGGGTPSQHSYGNALDIGAATMEDLYRIFHWILARADEFGIEHLIVDDIIWTRGVGIHRYTGERHYHVHADFVPNFSGACGVREAA